MLKTKTSSFSCIVLLEVLLCENVVNRAIVQIEKQLLNGVYLDLKFMQEMQ